MKIRCDATHRLPASNYVFLHKNYSEKLSELKKIVCKHFFFSEGDSSLKKVEVSSGSETDDGMNRENSFKLVHLDHVLEREVNRSKAGSAIHDFDDTRSNKECEPK